MSGSAKATASALTTPGFMPLQARLEQLEAGLRESLDRTDGITYYPHRENIPPSPSEQAEVTILSKVDALNGMAFELNQRLARIQEVTGGRI